MKQPSSTETDMTTTDETEQAREALPNATVQMVEEAGHFPRGTSVAPREVSGTFYRSFRTEELQSAVHPFALQAACEQNALAMPCEKPFQAQVADRRVQ